VSGLAKQYQDSVSVKYVNADTDPVAGKLNIQAVPTFIFIDEHGKVTARQVGFNESLLTQGFARAAGK
jgi:thioredoxin-like negative regulator of GroEL